MLKKEVQIGKKYTAKVSERIVTVQLLRDCPYGGWIALNLETGREVRIKSAAKLREEVA